eukprot:3818116-Pleurochrysis_carterae.AAC.1
MNISPAYKTDGTTGEKYTSDKAFQRWKKGQGMNIMHRRGKRRCGGGQKERGRMELNIGVES